MVKVQVDFSVEEDYILQVFKVKNRLKTKQEAVRAIVRMSGVEF
jgi:hypothetical protein